MNIRKDVNVLIIGGTGQGKSFFINMFDRMTVCPSLTHAELNTSDFLLPVKFYHEGEYTFESVDCSQATSQTEEPTIYEYPARWGTLRLIDTPGIGDTEGSQVDEDHMDKIISCICKFEKIHAILVFFKSTDNRLDARVKYQLCELLSCLGKAAVNNIQFIITHGGIRAELGQAPTVIQGFMKELSIAIPFNKSNTFCFENDPLKYLALKQQGKSSYDDDDVALFAITYQKSVKQYVRLFAKVFKCPQPYSVSEYRALAVARQIWPRLSMTLGNLSEINEGIKEALNHHGSSLDKILLRLAICETNLEKSKRSLLSKTAIACLVLTGTCIGGAAALILGPLFAVGGGLTGFVSSLFGLKIHQGFVEQEKNAVEKELQKESVSKEIEAKALEEQRAKFLRFNTERAKVKELDSNFADFLHQNTILAFTAAKVQILKEEIKSKSHTLCKEEKDRLEQSLENAKEQKKVFTQVSCDNQTRGSLTPDQLLDKVKDICNFQYYGPPIKKALDDCKIVNAASFHTVVRSEAGRGYIFDQIHEEYLKK